MPSASICASVGLRQHLKLRRPSLLWSAVRESHDVCRLERSSGIFPQPAAKHERQNEVKKEHISTSSSSLSSSLPPHLSINVSTRRRKHETSCCSPKYTSVTHPQPCSPPPPINTSQAPQVQENLRGASAGVRGPQRSSPSSRTSWFRLPGPPETRSDAPPLHSRSSSSSSSSPPPEPGCQSNPAGG